MDDLISIPLSPLPNLQSVCNIAQCGQFSSRSNNAMTNKILSKFNRINPTMSENERILPSKIDGDKSSNTFDERTRRFDAMRKGRHFVAKQVVRIILGYMSCSLASGVLTAWPTLVEVFEANNVFDEGCATSAMGKCTQQNLKFQNLYFIASAAIGILYVFTGQAFDVLGAKWIAVVGALGVALSFGAMALAVSSARFNDILWIAVPATDFFGYFNSFALMGFLYTFPSRQALLIGITNSSFNSASVMLYVLSQLANVMRLEWALLVMAAFGLLSALLAGLAVPSQDEYFFFAQLAGNPPMTRVPFRPLHSLRDGFNIASKRAVDNALFFVALLFGGIFVSFWTGSVFQFVNYAIGAENADRFGLASSIVVAVSGTCVTMLTGFLIDVVGLRIVVWFITLLLPSILLLSLYSDYWMFVTAFVCSNVFTTTMNNFLLKWMALYAEPALIGSCYGLLGMITGTLQLLFNFSIPSLMKSANKYDSYKNAYILLGSIAGLSWATFAVFVCCSTRPSTPPPCTSKHEPLCGRRDSQLLLNDSNER